MVHQRYRRLYLLGLCVCGCTFNPTNLGPCTDIPNWNDGWYGCTDNDKHRYETGYGKCKDGKVVGDVSNVGTGGLTAANACCNCGGGIKGAY